MEKNLLELGTPELFNKKQWSPKRRGEMKSEITLKSINECYEKILHSDLSDDEKTRRYAELMTDMEREYRIPALRNVAWKKENRAVISLYRKISMSRKL